MENKTPNNQFGKQDQVRQDSTQTGNKAPQKQENLNQGTKTTNDQR